MPMEHWKTRLHNKVAGNRWKVPEYDFTPFGQHHAPMWLCIVKLQGAEYGRGDASTKGAAAELAAKRAFEELVRMGY
ncbi:hypothetical protein FB107DRAFT_271552 [Schizophyllum commune]